MFSFSDPSIFWKGTTVAGHPEVILSEVDSKETQVFCMGTGDLLVGSLPTAPSW